MILGKLERQQSPHQARAREAVHQQNSRSFSAATQKYCVSCDLD
jgi:hypothetical protein